ncbi:MAG: chlorohydrolase family protein, partial [Alphaproteobacteria bacterium]
MAAERATGRPEPPRPGGGVTLIKGGWVVGFDGARHRLITNGAVAFEDDLIVHVGRAWEHEVAQVIDASGKLVVPGFISSHAHIASHSGDRLIVDGGRRDFVRSGFLNYEPRKRAGGPAFLAREDQGAALRFGLASLLRSGVTTVVEMGGAGDDQGRRLVELAGECGIRLYYAPGYTAADYAFDTEGRLERVWDEAAGLRGLEAAIAFIERNHDAHGGRIQGMLVPFEAFCATPLLLRRTKEAAERLGVGIAIHAAEQLYEFHEALRTKGRTPVGVLEAEGFLGPEVILGHCAYVDGHSLTGYPYAGDLAALARSRASVAHCPVALSRRGAMLESFQRYLDHGVNLSIGTDSYPLDIIDEMRWASILCKVHEANNESASARDVFNAATLGGATALRRGDLGRLASGAKADIVVVDFERLRVGPVSDPIRALVHSANAELVDRVIVAGRTVVDGGRLTMWDENRVLREARASTERVWDSFPDYHWSGRTVEEVFPP